MQKLPESEQTLKAQALVLGFESQTRQENSFYAVSSDSTPLSPEEMTQLEVFSKEKLAKWKTAAGYNTLTVRKQADGTWVGMRKTWTEGWSKPRTSLQALLKEI